MFNTVQLGMHATNQKLEGNVCKKSLHLRKLTCSVLLHFKVCDLFRTMHLHMHTVKIIICGPRRKQ